MSANWPSVFDAMSRCKQPQSRSATLDAAEQNGCSLSTRDRFVLHDATIKSTQCRWRIRSHLERWQRAQRSAGTVALFRFRNARLVEVNYKGGRRRRRGNLLRAAPASRLGYHFVRLVENDSLLAPDGSRRCGTHLTRQTTKASASALSRHSDTRAACLSVAKTIRSIGREAPRWCFLLAKQPAFSWRTTPHLEMTSQQIRGFYAEQFGVALHEPEWAVGGRWMDGR